MAEVKRWVVPVSAVVGLSLGLALIHLSQASASPSFSEPLPLVCRAPDPERIDGVCHDGTGPVVMMRGFQVILIGKETYLVGFPQ